VGTTLNWGKFKIIYTHQGQCTDNVMICYIVLW